MRAPLRGCIASHRLRALAVALGAGGFATVLAMAATAPAQQPPPKAVPRATSGYLPRTTPVPGLPDTVVARVDGRVDITVRELADGVARLARTTRPDTVDPARRREMLGVLVDKAVISRRALRETWVWTREESASYHALRDRLTLDAALDSAARRVNAARVARGDTALAGEALGIESRESNVLVLEPQFDRALLARIAVSFDTLPRPRSTMPLQKQIEVAGAVPEVAEADLDRVLAHTRRGPYTVRELIESWRRLNPIYRPRVSTADQVADLVKNGLFERELRRVVREQRLEERPDIARALEQQREFYAVSHFVQREVYDRIPTDSVTLRRHYQREIDSWDLPPRSTVLRMYLPDSAGAIAMAARLRDRAEAESLAAKAGRAGISYLTEVSPYGDSLVYVRASRGGVGAVLGPEWTPEGWLVQRVMTLDDRRHRTFREAHTFVQRDWVEKEGERRMRALLDRLRASTRVAVNERALGDSLAAPGRRGSFKTGQLWKQPGR